MGYEEVKQQQGLPNDSKGFLSQNGIITETIKRFQGSLPWMNRNNRNNYIHQQQTLTAV
jgi:hypothetical protein